VDIANEVASIEWLDSGKLRWVSIGCLGRATVSTDGSGGNRGQCFRGEPVVDFAPNPIAVRLVDFDTSNLLWRDLA
jgi:hypothetical protein